MHYYQFHIGDYQRDTIHLDDMEDLAYRRLLDLYYKDEQPISLDLDRVAKLIRMRSHSDCIASVLREYFERTDDGWVNHRVESELQRSYAKSESAKRSAEARWKRKNAKKPKQNQEVNANAMRTDSEGNANGMLPITQDPLPNTHNKPKELSHSDKPNTDDVEQAFESFWSAGMRKVGSKKDTFTKFKRLAGKDPHGFAQMLIADVKRRLASGQMGFDQLHPKTYLNGERWNDEYVSNLVATAGSQDNTDYYRDKAKQDPFL